MRFFLTKMPGFVMLPLLVLTLLSHPVVAAESVVKKRSKPRQNGFSVVSVVPAQAEAGDTVVLTGRGLSSNLQVRIGNYPVKVKVIDDTQLELHLPNEIEAGVYALIVRALDGAGRSIAFNIQPSRPAVSNITPSRLTACAAGDARYAVVKGRNFKEVSQLLFDGAIISGRYISAEEIGFNVPNVSAGLHQVAVKNGDMVSTPLGLLISATPEINSVTVGTSNVNSYDLLIEGNNFYPNSAVMVDGTVVGGGGLQTEQVIFQDCNRLIYRRKPVSSTPRELRITVLNPNGEASAAVQVAAP